MDAHFELRADLDFGGQTIDPIGDSSGSFGDWDAPFEGTLDGNGFGIDNFTIDVSQDFVGLFGAIATDAVISDLTIAGADVSGDDFVGILAGATYGDIIDVTIDGDVSGDAEVGLVVGYLASNRNIDNTHTSGSADGTHSIGGLAGRSDGTIIDSSSSATITGSTEYIGGLVGDHHNNGNCEVFDSSATGDVDAPGADEVGGLVGRNRDDCLISNSSATGEVTGDGTTGGFVGEQRGEIYRSFATGDVDGGADRIGGFVGRIHRTGEVYDSYATGNVEGQQEVGGFVGDLSQGTFGFTNGEVYRSYSTGTVSAQVTFGGFVGNNDGDVVDCYFNSTTSGINSSNGAVPVDGANFDSETSFNGFDFADTWSISTQDGQTRPLLQWWIN